MIKMTCRGLISGIPWQMTSLTDVQQLFGNWNKNIINFSGTTTQELCPMWQKSGGGIKYFRQHSMNSESLLKNSLYQVQPNEQDQVTFLIRNCKVVSPQRICTASAWVCFKVLRIGHSCHLCLHVEIVQNTLCTSSAPLKSIDHGVLADSNRSIEINRSKLFETCLIIVQGWRVAFSIDASLVNDAIDLVGGDADSNGLEGLVKHLAAQLASNAKIWNSPFSFHIWYSLEKKKDSKAWVQYNSLLLFWFSLVFLRMDTGQMCIKF